MEHFPRYWPFVRGIHRSMVNSPHKGQWRGALMFSLICVWINGWISNREAGHMRRYRAHYIFTVMCTWRHITLSHFTHIIGSQCPNKVQTNCIVIRVLWQREHQAGTMIILVMGPPNIGQTTLPSNLVSHWQEPVPRMISGVLPNSWIGTIVYSTTPQYLCTQ